MRGFDRLPADALAALASTAAVHRHAPGDHLIRRGERAQTLYVLRAGTVRVPLTHAPQRLRDDIELRAGAVFGELAALSDGLRTADVVAVDAVEAVSFDRAVIEPLLWEHPELALVLTELVAYRLERTAEIQQVGSYALGGPLGRGGTSRVYAGEHVTTGRPVAIKMLDHRLAYDRSFRDRFLLEAEIVAGLDHPNIVAVLDTETAFATYFIVMERVDGMDLRALLRRRGQLGEGPVRSLLAQAGEALSHAHQRGVLHRDVKPSNCIVDGRGVLQLTDFGIATWIDHGRAPSDEPVGVGVSVGTPRYLAPEVIRGQRPTQAADWYAFGVMAFELLAGRAPFKGVDVPDLLNRHLWETPALDELAPVASAELREAIAALLVKDPARRVTGWPLRATDLFEDTLGIGPEPAAITGTATTVDLPLPDEEDTL